MDLPIRWERSTSKYGGGGEDAFLGRIKVGGAFYDGLTSRDDPKRYGCECLLPGIKQARERYASIDEAKSRLERQIRNWLSWIGADRNKEAGW